ncbi:MAG: M1 family metallopeptidase [Planctomycetota bacterium]
MLTPRSLFVAAPFFLLVALGVAFSRTAEERVDRFRQLEEVLPTPNAQRAASGAPGHAYWQQQVDYAIEVELDEDRRHITGSERIRYQNNSPDTLTYLWLQIEANLYRPEAHGYLASAGGAPQSTSFDRLTSMLARREFDGGASITRVQAANGDDLPHTIVDTMMRVDLPQPLAPGGEFTFGVDWNYAVNDSDKVGARTGYEHFEEDGNDLFEMAHWFPRLCAYTDVNGWQNKQFLGRGEFTLEFGDYDVAITVPSDHVVASTGVLQNPEAVLQPLWRERLARAAQSDRPIMIVTKEEAEANEATRANDTATWRFHADNVRDFAWASSRKFLWDAFLKEQTDGEPVWCMSYWPKEGEPLWSRYSTHSIAHTIDVYGRLTFPYPYPVAISVNGPVGGMEYPMICFNGPRPETDGTYSKRTKYGLIGVIIHEVGHNWFPMIVNSDERQWTWMDEGLNTFCQFVTEQEWEAGYPSRRGEPKDIVGYMRSENTVPIMTNSESILQFGPNAYAKPATALNILRETILGRELFDFAFKEYANRWKFKRPQPADLFRTLEDASAVDLDWFWRGWFYTTDNVDLALTGLSLTTISTQDPNVEKGLAKAKRAGEPRTVSAERFADVPKRTDRFPELLDFYNTFDELDVTPGDLEAFEKKWSKYDEHQRALLASELRFYTVGLANLGGIPMPVHLEVEYADGETETFRLPVQLWQQNADTLEKLLIVEREIVSLTLDPRLETADVDLSNNHWPPRIEESRMELTVRGERKNPMQTAQQAAERAAKAAEADDLDQPADTELEEDARAPAAGSGQR